MGRLLIVHPPEGSLLPIERDAALGQKRAQTVALELRTAERSGEKTPLIFNRIGFNEISSIQMRLQYFHPSLLYNFDRLTIARILSIG